MINNSKMEIATREGVAENKKQEFPLGELGNAEGKNTKWVLCERCGSKVIRPNAAKLVKNQFSLPMMVQKKNGQDNGKGSEEDNNNNNDNNQLEQELFEDFYLLADMFDFENVGFSNTVANTKYLTCADCEIGPIGYMDIEQKNMIYVAVNRVAHSE
eukprot:Nk52_evm20s485 gene=Nk52_evmTU20s485